MVAMNRADLRDKDVAALEPGGYLFYDSLPTLAALEACATIIVVHGHAADRDLQPPNIRTRKAASTL